MGLLSMFQSKPQGAAKGSAAAASGDVVQQIRTRARRRLIGALVLVVVGIIGFPLLFETQPRPIPVDIPIEIPRKDGVPPLSMPAGRPKAPVATAPAEPASAVTPADIVTESRADAGRDVAPAVSPPVASAPVEPPPPKPAAVSAKSAPKPAVDEGARAQALLDGTPAVAPAAKKDGTRYVVQVGAFADAGAARATRLKVEKLGLKTYTQVAKTSDGDRIRVRVGPFSSRDEADRALAKAKAAGVSAVVLTL